jgi:hypothetical protein
MGFHPRHFGISLPSKASVQSTASSTGVGGNVNFCTNAHSEIHFDADVRAFFALSLPILCFRGASKLLCRAYACVKGPRNRMDENGRYDENAGECAADVAAHSAGPADGRET